MATLTSYLTNQHVDLNVGTNGTAWTISPQNSDEFPAVVHDSEDGLVYVGAPALSSRAAAPEFDFTGVSAGANYYRLPQSQNPNLPYVGFAAYGVSPGGLDAYNPFTEAKGRVNGSGRWVKVSLVDVDHFRPDGTAGTGTFSAWQSGDTGPVVFMSNFNDGVSNPVGGLDATDGISADDGLWILAGGHLHFNFGFSEKGRYEVTLKASAYFGSDGNSSTPNTADYRESPPIKLYFSVQSVGRLEFDTASYSVNEGAGTASVKVRRVEGSDGELTVSYGTSNGTAATGADYTATSGTLTFADGEIEKTIVIPILEDLLSEGDETVNLTLSAPGPATIAGYVSSPDGDNSNLLGSQATAILTIVDNEGPLNTAPTISAVADLLTDEDVSTGAIAFTIGDAETAVAGLAVTAVSSNTTLVPNANVVLGGSGANRTVTVTPTSNLFGTTTITLTVTDGGGLQAVETFLLTVSSVNDPPTISDINNQTVPLNGTTGAVAFTVGDTETAAGSLVVSGASSNTTLVPNANIVFGGSGANRTVTVTPASGQSGSATITVTVADAEGGSVSDTFVLTVSGNSPPTISGIDDQFIPTDSGTGAIAFTIGDAETSADDLIVTATSSEATLVPPGGIALGGSGANRTITLTPAAGQSGSTTITLTVTDTSGGSSSRQFVLFVSPTNTPPTISDVTNQTISENATTGLIAFDVGDGETPAGVLLVTATSSNTTLVPNANLVLGGAGSARIITATPAANQSGSTTITLTVTDQGGLTAVDTFVLVVQPSIVLLDEFTVAEDSGPTTLDVLINDTLGRLAVTGVASGTGGQIVIAPDGRSLIYTPHPDFSGTEWLFYTVTDEHGGSSVSPLTITVLNTPDAPTAAADVYQVDPARSVFGNVLFNDADADGDAITATLVTSPTRGILSFASDGSFRYKPGATFVGTDSFTYSATDGGLTSGIVTVTINLAPAAVFDAYLTEGHADIGVALGHHDHEEEEHEEEHEEAAWDLHVHDGENDVEYEPQHAVIVVGAAALTARPANPAFAFVGVNAGENYYRLPESENPELPYLGLGTEEIEDGTFLSGALTLRLKAVNGPGHFSLWQSGDTGPNVFMTTFDGISANDQIELLEGGHAHANFGFSARGTYEVVFEAFGVLADGDATSSGDVSYFFTVNSAPEAEDDAYTATEETTLTVPAGTGLLANDSDPDGDTLIPAVVEQPQNGRVTVNADGSFTYVPNANFSGTDTFTYAVTDQRYRLIPLGTLGGNNSFANDVNINRQVTGNSSLTAGSSNPLQAYLWQNGEFVPLGVLAGTGSNNFSRGYGLNDDGVIVGESDNNTSLAFVYQDAVMSGLTRLAGDNFRGVSNDINNDGVIVGSSSNGTAVRPTIWTFDGTTYVAADLGTIRGTPSSTGRAWAINDAGVVVGLSHNADGASQATMWNGGTITNLTSLGDGERFSQAYGLNNVGDVVGASSTGQTVGQLIGTTSSTSITRAFVWHDGHLHELSPHNFYAPGNTGATTNYHSEAKDVNDAGIVVGNSQRIAGSPASATIWADEAVFDLNSLIVAGSGWVLRSAEGINQGGDIVGYGAFGGFTRAFLLVPELVNPDGRFFSETATVTITVTPTADPPTAADDAYQTEFGDVLRGNVLFNDSDPDGDVLFVASSTPAAEGTVVLQADGSFIYTPNANFDGTDSFTYVISDGQGGTDSATVTITLAIFPDFEAELSEGHADIGVFAGSEDTVIDHGDHTHVIEGEFGWDLHVHDHDSDVEYHADEALLVVRANAITARPTGTQFDFIGVSAGENFWRLPESENPELLFLGLGAEEIEAGTFAGGELSLRLVSVNGPGQVSIWRSGDTGPEVLMATADGVTSGDLATLLEGGHSHVNWGFTAPGRYEVTFQAFGVLADGSRQTSEATTYYFEVASGSLTAALAGSVLTVLDTAGAENNFEIHTSGGWLVITDPTEVFSVAPPGAVLSNGNHTLSIPLAGLTALQIAAAGGADHLLLGDTTGLPLVTLIGGDGDDTFGSPTSPLKPSYSTEVRVIGDEQPTGGNQAATTGDLLHLDLSDFEQAGQIVDTIVGAVNSMLASAQRPLRFQGLESVSLRDAHRPLDIGIGDFYLRSLNQSENFVLYRDGGTRIKRNGAPLGAAPSAGIDRLVFHGRGGNDYFESNFTFGTAYAVAFFGEDGNDTLVGGLGNDLLVGGSGADTLRGGEGDDQLFGEDLPTTDGDIPIATQRATGLVYSANGGNDNLDGGAGNDVLFGGIGDDTLNGGLGNDYVHGGEGNDTLNSGGGNDILRGEAGADLLNGNSGNDILLGGSGDDRVFGRGGRDFMFGGAGADQIQDDEASADVVVAGRLAYDADDAFTQNGTSILGRNDNDLTLWALMFTGADAWTGGAALPSRIGRLASLSAMENDAVADVVLGNVGGADYIVSHLNDLRLNTAGDTLLTL